MLSVEDAKADFVVDACRAIDVAKQQAEARREAAATKPKGR